MLKTLLSPKFKKYISNTFWLIFEKVFTLGLSLAVSIYIARYLQPEAFGLLNYAISFAGIFASLSSLGVDRILVRELAKSPERRDDLLGTCFVVKLIGSTIVVVLITLILVFTNNSPLTNTLILIIASAELFRAFDVVSSFYQSLVQSKHVAQVQIVVNIIGNILKIGLLLSHASITWFAVVTAINVVFNAIGYIYSYKKRKGDPLNWSFKKSLAFQFLKESWPITLHGVALQTQAKIDQVMLGDMMNNYEVGQYSVAMKFIEMYGIIPMMLVSTFLPAVTNAKSISIELYHDRIINFYRLMFIIFLVVAIPIFFFGEEVIVLLYDEEYRPAGYLFSLFSIRILFANIGVGKNFYILNESLFKNSLLNAVIGAALNISINYFLIPIYGAIGAIIAFIISLTVSTFVVDAFFSKTRENLKLAFAGVSTFWKINKIT